jgi:DNA polymerase III delta prime subunit
MTINFFPNFKEVKPADFNSRGEFKLLEKFDNVKNLADWTIIHSLKLSQHIKQESGEIDFIIIMPNKGILVIEVKDHKSVTWDPKTNIWKLGQDKPNTQGPFAQLIGNRRSFIKTFRSNRKLNSIYISELLVFTRIEEIECQFEISKSDYLGCDDLKLEGRDFIQLFENRLNEEKYKNIKKPKLFFINDKSPTVEQMQILNEIRKPVNSVITSEMRKEILTNDLKSAFTENQLRIYHSISDNKKILVEGPSGTGKTLLAIEASKIAFQSNKQTLLLCFNRLLGEYLKKEINDYSKVVKAISKNELFREIIKDNSKIPEESSKQYFDELPNRVVDYLLVPENKFQKYDQIIIDESQDLLDQQTLDILDLILKGGLKNGHFLFFGDFEIQNVQNKKLVNMELFKNKFGPTYFKLKDNCRNTPDIVAFAKFFCKCDPYERILRTDEKSDPTSYMYSDQYDLFKQLNQLIERLVKQKFEYNEITILTQKTRLQSKFLDLINAIGTNGLIEKLLSRNTVDATKFSHLKKLRNNFYSIREFKGLEQNVIIIIDLENLDNLQERNLLHIGMTRTLEKLFLFHQQEFNPV